MEAHDGLRRLSPDLYEIAELIRNPQASPVVLLTPRLFPAGERVVDRAAVLDLTDEPSCAHPDPQQPGAAAVANAVRRHLVDGEDEVVRPRRVEARVGRARRQQLAERFERPGVELELLDRGGRGWEWVAERGRERR